MIHYSHLVILSCLASCSATADDMIVGIWECAPTNIPNPAHSIFEFRSDGTGLGLSRVSEDEQLEWVGSTKIKYTLVESELEISFSEAKLRSYTKNGKPITGNAFEQKAKELFQNETAEPDYFEIISATKSEFAFLANGSTTEVRCHSISKLPEEFL